MGVTKGDTTNLDYSSYSIMEKQLEDGGGSGLV